MNVKKLSKTTGYLCLFGIAIHVLLCIFLITMRNRDFVGKHALVTRIYKRISLPGPFFDERRIRFIPQFYISYKETGKPQWSAYRNVERENFMRYHNAFFDYGSLKRSTYERFTARKVSRRMTSTQSGSIMTTPEFLELHRYLKDNYFPEKTDSVSVLYTAEHIQEDGKSLMDTTFVLTYKSF